LALRLAEAFDMAEEQPAEAAYARLMTPAVKYLICKTAPAFLYEAMECLGGNGFVEESALPRSTGRRRSMRSGRDRATSWRSTWSGR
jgi:putative acyl-CoA dehydrogenase